MTQTAFGGAGPATRKIEGGATLVEVMASLIVILSGLLGLAGLQAKVQQVEAESYQRAQALKLVHDMVDRIGANRRAGRCYAFTTGPGGTELGAGRFEPPPCPAALGSGDLRAGSDLTDWNRLLKAASDASGSGKLGAMPGARGCVSRHGNSDHSVTYSVAVSWQSPTAAGAPAYPKEVSTATRNAIDCGMTQQRSDANGVATRRVVWTSFDVANLM